MDGCTYLHLIPTQKEKKHTHHPLTHSLTQQILDYLNHQTFLPLFFFVLSLSLSLPFIFAEKILLNYIFFFNYFSFFDHFVVFFLLSQILFNFTFLLIYFINGCSKYLTLIYSSLLLLLSQFYKYHYYHLFYFLLCFVLF